jgi:hypothetical protein
MITECGFGNKLKAYVNLSKIHCLNSDWTWDLSLLRYKPDFVTCLFSINKLYCISAIWGGNENC